MAGINFSSTTTASIQIDLQSKVETLANLLNFALNNSSPSQNMQGQLSDEDKQDFQGLLVSLRALYQ